MLALLISCIIAVSLGLQNLKVRVHSSAQAYYLRLSLVNADAASRATCGASISSVKIYVNNAWVSYSSSPDQDQGDPTLIDFAWDYNGVKFTDMIGSDGISLQVVTTKGTINMWGIIKNLNGGATFTASETICQGITAEPTTPRPTSRPTAPTTPHPTSERQCTDKTDILWKSYNNQIYFNNNRFNMKGLSWFGFETPNRGLYGLDKHDMDWYFDWMVERGFNAIRMPFASDFINGGDSNLNAYVNAVKAAGEKGLLVMLDMHSKTIGSWRDGLYTIDQTEEVGTWRKVAAAMVAANVWNVLFVDVFNEPHDVKNSQWTQWVEFCERVAEAVWEEGLEALIAVEGTNSECSIISCCWGENLEGVRNTGKTFEASKTDKFVWSPHVYTGDVTGNFAYSDPAWRAHWGYLAENHPTNEGAIVIGEFGTRDQSKWLDDLVDYLLEIDQKNHFFWCLNPNSGDTGGLLKADWTEEETWKLTILDRLQPNPSKIDVYTNRICVSGLGDGSGSSPVSSPSEPAAEPAATPTSRPTNRPTNKPTSAGNSGSTITIKQNTGCSRWWCAVEFPGGDLGRISKLEYRDDRYTSWVECDKTSWGFTIPRSGGAFSGNQDYRVTTGNGRTVNNNVFNGMNGGDTSQLSVASAYTEDGDTVGDSSLTWAGLAAIIVCSLLCVLCIGCGVYYYKRSGVNKGEASFQSTAADTPEPSKGNDTPQATTTNNAEDEAEIEVEMNVSETQQ